MVSDMNSRSRMQSEPYTNLSTCDICDVGLGGFVCRNMYDEKFISNVLFLFVPRKRAAFFLAVTAAPCMLS